MITGPDFSLRLFPSSTTLLSRVLLISAISLSDAYDWNCVDPKECSNQAIVCPQNEPCNVYCHATKSCQLATIDGSSSTELAVYCLGTSSCEDADIQCGSGDCNIICSGTGSKHCKSLHLNCGAGECTVTCDSTASCLDSAINVDKTSSFHCTGECPSDYPSSYPFTTKPSTDFIPLVHHSSTTALPTIYATEANHEGNHDNRIVKATYKPTNGILSTSSMVPSNWIKKGAFTNCPDGTTDLDADHRYRDEYCQICPDNTAGINGICNECATLKVPNHSNTDCIFMHPWWLYALETVVGLCFFLFVGFCTQRCCKKDADSNDHVPSDGDSDVENPPKRALSPKAIMMKMHRTVSEGSEGFKGLLETDANITTTKATVVTASALQLMPV